MAEITLYFVITVLKPDKRPYGRAVELTPLWSKDGEQPLRVAVNVPLEHGYLANATDIIKAQLDSNPVPMAILTPAGMRFITDVLEAPYGEPDVTPDDFKSEPTISDGWEGANETVDVTDENPIVTNTLDESFFSDAEKTDETKYTDSPDEWEGQP